MNNRSLNSKEDLILNMIRKENKKKISICYYCKKQSTEINCIEHRIVFVCDDHFEAGVEMIIDLSNPNIVHIIYPNGLQLNAKELDPNIGGLAPRGQKVSK